MPHDLITLSLAARREGPDMDNAWHLLRALAHELDEAGSVQGLATALHDQLGDLTALEVITGLNQTLHQLSHTLFTDLLAARQHDPIHTHHD